MAGRPRHKNAYRGAESSVGFLPKIKFEILVPANGTQSVIETISNIVRTGEVGDGEIFVTELTSVIRIHTTEVEKALA